MDGAVADQVGVAARTRLGAPSLFRIGRLLLAGALSVCAAARANALETRVIEDFSQIMAVQPRPAGGFGIVGFLKREAGKTPQGFLQIAANGAPIGRPVVLPSPDDENPDAWVWGLLALPDGDYVASGWAMKPNGKPNAWAIRFTPDGDIVWNILLPNENNWDQRLYSVKRLGDGRLIAVGRSQAGAEARQPSRGLIAVLDEITGEERPGPTVAALGDALRCGVPRCGFQDVTQLADGTLVLAGWLTKTDGKDDALLLKLGPDLKRIKFVSIPEADIALSAISTGGGVTVGGMTRKNRESPLAVAVSFDRDLSRKIVFNLDRLAPAFSTARAIHDVPLTNQLLVAGETQRNNAADPNAIGGLFQSNSASLEKHGSTGPSRFRAVAVDPGGTIVLAGDWAEARGRPTRGLVVLRREAKLCEQDAGKLDEISAALAARTRVRHVACVRSDSPARFKLGDGAKDVAVVIRPLIGDIDAFLTSGAQIVDASLNAGRRAEFLVLPADGKPVELTVSTAAAYATFEIGLVRPGDRPDQKAETSRQNPWQGFALHALGYDLLGQGGTDDGQNEIVDMRAVMAFQAGEGLLSTGTLDADHANLLNRRAARQVDGDARQAASIARTVAERSRTVEFKDGDPILESMTGALHEGRVYGRGKFPFGTFEGDWIDGLDAGSRMRPRLGVLQFSNECSLAFRAASDHLIPDADDTGKRPIAEDYLATLVNSSIGVLRHGKKIAFFGDLMGQLASDVPDMKEAIEDLCSVAPKEEPEQ